MKLIQKIQSVLSPDLLKPSWTLRGHPLSGHRYVASEVLYHLWGKKKGFKPQVIEVEIQPSLWVTHWYLKKGVVILDPTSEQFPFRIPYNEGRGCGFLTSKPSKRAKEVIRRLTNARL